MKLIMTLLVRDEEDIIEENILFHLTQGIDFIIVMDNLSVDSTADILKKYQHQGKLHYIYQPEDNYNQHKWVTAMARLAFEQYGANWVINNDADEFWIARKGDLKTTLSLLESSINAVKAQRFNFPLAIHEVENENKPFYEHMIYQETVSFNPLGKPLPPKVLHRGHSEVVVAQGNHDVDIPDKKMIDGIIDIYHFPLRTKKQFINKIAKGGQAYQNNHELPLGMGSTWRSLYQSLVNEGNINDYLSSEILEKMY